MANDGVLNLPAPGVARTDLVLLALFTAIQSAGFFSAALPSVFTIDRFAGDDRARQKLTDGLMHAWLLSLGMGLVVSVLVRSPLPLFFTFFVALMFSTMYGGAMRNAMAGGEGYAHAG